MTSKLRIAFILASISTVRAASIAIPNGDFQTDALAAGAFDFDAPANWGGDGAFWRRGATAGFDSTNVALDAPNPDFPAQGLIWQDLTTSWAANTRYTLTVSFGNTGSASAVGRLGFGSDVDAVPVADTALYVPSLLHLDVPVTSVAAAAQTSGDALFVFTTGPVVPSGHIRITAQHAAGGAFNVDHFRLDASPVPEPGNHVAGLMALAAILRHRRRRRD